ncbi:(2Fe-2S) ferredoxin domain-containing protein [Sporomusa acidovorans]|uniref:Ion-translocating oxidoreductase complex subunit C n=1 Tax=Sporomusa acidovorans (strain ATCC 49682 / DSM 3132 / Mol) TaxID=1123286 RepID=A0ABZ3J1M4_SPOA4|nr:hypothetical protein [Sporomusa acidovorans]OZC18082.1 NADP-reducing hydrogenase subunit HndC [Sporomusa acidovorans DSM 3132]SDF72729.1 Respiratory-chain NADH dehydrogenase subunit [Sporomusa acidovorans]
MSGYWYPSVRSYQVSASTIKSIQKAPALPSYKPVNYDLHIPLQGLAEEGRATLCSTQTRITVGMATCGRAAGASAIYQSLVGRNWEGKAKVHPVGCVGACYAEPFVTIRTAEGMYYFYGNVDSNALWSIIKTAQGMPATAYSWAVAQERKIGEVRSIRDLQVIQTKNSGFQEFFKPQVRRISGRCGLVDPESIAEYVAMDGYFALKKALFELKAENIMKLITAAGLRGRGGAGFLTGEKWQVAARSLDPIRYVVANADEGDPGAYMDRALLESDPHSVLEGLIIAAYAVGASQGYIFVRHEYPLAIKSLRQAIAAARKVGLLGPNILGSKFSLKITLVESGGAFVCGEETSLLQVMDNKRGEPRQRPPYPAIKGLRTHPTLVNNVETLANVPWIILQGAGAFREAGTEKSPGTKIFCLTGDVKRIGFIEQGMFMKKGRD